MMSWLLLATKPTSKAFAFTQLRASWPDSEMTSPSEPVKR